MAEPKVSAPAEVSKMMNGATKTVLVVEDNDLRSSWWRITILT
jgi:hypothetical protein